MPAVSLSRHWSYGLGTQAEAIRQQGSAGELELEAAIGLLNARGLRLGLRRASEVVREHQPVDNRRARERTRSRGIK